MVEIKVTGNTPLEALSSLAAFSMHCMQDAGVCAAATRILEAEKHQEKKLAAEAQNGVTQAPQEAPVQEPVSDTPQTDPAPTAAPGPADGANGPTAAPGGKTEPVPTVEQVRAKGIEAARRYGNPAVKAILTELGVPGMGALTPEQRPVFLAKLEGLGEGNA